MMGGFRINQSISFLRSPIIGVKAPLAEQLDDSNKIFNLVPRAKPTLVLKVTFPMKLKYPIEELAKCADPHQFY
jgi:hypothetical protein